MSDSKAKPKPKGKQKPADANGKGDKGKGKKGKAKAGASTEEAGGRGLFSVAANPRASQSIRLAKGWGGLAGFAIAVCLSLSASVPVADALLRGLLAGAAGYLLGWACSVTIWRQVMIGQIREAAEEASQRRAEAVAQQPTINAE